jgi:proline iminopeptidase
VTSATIEPFDSGLFTVSDGAEIYWEVSGNPRGLPMVWLHGGPGTGLLSGGYKRAPDPERWMIVGLDQRACGRSRPLATEPGFDLSTLTTQAMIADLEELREHLGIRRWLVAGGSWGTTLALAYGEAHPDRVLGFVLVAVTTGSHAEIEWISESMGRVFPREWDDFAAASGRVPGQRLLDAYVQRLTDPDPNIRSAAALAWCVWEDTHVSLAESFTPWLSGQDPQFRELFALHVAHSWANDAFLGEQGVLDGLGRIAHLPAVLIHGRLDVSSPLVTAWELHKRLPESQLVVIEHEGHGGKGLSAAVGAAYAELLPQVAKALKSDHAEDS